MTRLTERAWWAEKRQQFTEWITPGKWVVIATTANVLSTGIFVLSAFHASEEARRHNCVQVAEAFAGYTNALAEVSHADPETVAEFRAQYEPLVNTCR